MDQSGKIGKMKIAYNDRPSTAGKLALGKRWNHFLSYDDFYLDIKVKGLKIKGLKILRFPILLSMIETNNKLS